MRNERGGIPGRVIEEERRINDEKGGDGGRGIKERLAGGEKKL